MTLLYKGYDWDYDTLSRIQDACQEASDRELGLSTYPTRLEIITSEQMLDAYSSVGMPILYKHWSFGKDFTQHELVYRKGMGGLAYEIVINSDPCIAYIMEENSATMQALVIAHAAFGHNHFFKNNYLFKQWTDASTIIDYLEFASKYVASCEEKYGEAAVEAILDAAHALQFSSVFRFPRKQKRSLKEEEERNRNRLKHQESSYNELWSTIPGGTASKSADKEYMRRMAMLDLPQENILYFVEKFAPRLHTWQREVIRIVRQVAQYFYPQGQTKVMNEGCATYVHYRIMTRLHQDGKIDDGAFLEFLKSHTGVVLQPRFNDHRYSGINPYALGFDMCRDIERICTEPTNEDREWFPDIAGRGGAEDVLKDVWANYRDESFVSQFLSPHLMRQWRMFHIKDDRKHPNMVIESIHNERGYRNMRSALARRYDVSWATPDIQVTDVDLVGSRTLELTHHVKNGRCLEPKNAASTVQHLADLWGYPVSLVEKDDSMSHRHSAVEPRKVAFERD